jgi:hypothetical protein
MESNSTENKDQDGLAHLVSQAHAVEHIAQVVTGGLGAVAKGRGSTCGTKVQTTESASAVQCACSYQLCRIAVHSPT